jgi:glycosyltransferase involved in cell wall biosynthesis
VDAKTVCLIGKYPPIQGGMSRLSYLIALQLANGGFQVHVVSDSAEFAPSHVARWSGWDAILPPPVRNGLNPKMPVLHTSSEHISGGLPTTVEPRWTKLLSASIEAGKNSDACAMMSVYLEPYAVVAGQAARVLGIPHIVVTGGSDVGFLTSQPALREAYRHTLLLADAVLCSPKASRSLLELGVPISRLFPIVVPPMDPEFSPSGPKLDVTQARLLLNSPGAASPEFQLHARIAQRSRFDPVAPTLGFYGKIGAEKGTFDLIDAASQLFSRGQVFNVLGLTQPTGFDLTEFEDRLIGSGLSECTTLLPYLPYTAVPKMLRSCAAVLCLERGFPISIHGPRTPAEVISCGSALVISEELRRKQPASEVMRDGENCYVYAGADHEELSEKLGGIISNVPEARSLATRASAELLPHYLALEDRPATWPEYFDFLSSAVYDAPAEGGKSSEIERWVHGFRMLAEVSAWPQHTSP